MRVMNKYNTHKHVLFNKRINDNLEHLWNSGLHIN